MSENIEKTVQDAQDYLDSVKLDPKDWQAYAKRSEDERIALGTLVIGMRMKGYSLRKIEEATGIPRQTARRYRDLAYARVADPVVKAELQESLDRLDEALEAIWSKVLLGDVAAVTTMLKIEERRAKMLGLDSAIKVEATTTEITAQERELQEMLAQAERDAKLKAAALAETVD